MQLTPKGPFSLSHTLRFILSPPALLNGRRFEPLLDHSVDGEYRRLVDLDGDLVLYGVSESGAGSRQGLSVRVLHGRRDSNTLRAISGLAARQFGLDVDLSGFYDLAGKDCVLSHLAKHFRGMRIPQAPTVYETLISAIIEQQVNLSFAHKVKRVLIEAYGRSLDHDGRSYHCFPEPAALAITTPTELRKLEVSGPKSGYIIGISRAVLDGSFDVEGLRQLEPAAAAEKLMAFKGVGCWTSQYVGLRALGHLDCLPSGDVGLQNAMGSFYGHRRQPTPKWVERTAKAWAGWRSYATFYLWLTYWEAPQWREDLRVQIQADRIDPPRSTRQRR
ncbi:MAG TPA: DNA-3-methyladenine glycosylase [Terriglobia bacterium]|nr:DNA-3-methyladenine glycosylase [Terriglobia bacterium]